MNTAPHMKAWPWVARFFCAHVLGHQDRNYAGPTMHYAYCLRCGYLFGHPWAVQRTAEKQMYGNKPECLCHFCTMDRVRNIVRESCPHGQVCTYCFGTKKVEQSDGSNRPCNYCNGTGCEPSTAHIGDEES